MISALQSDEVISVKESVYKIYALCKQPLVSLPKHIIETLDHLDLLSSVHKVEGHKVSDLLTQCIAQLSKQDKLNIIRLVGFLFIFSASICLLNILNPKYIVYFTRCFFSIFLKIKTMIALRFLILF